MDEDKKVNPQDEVKEETATAAEGTAEGITGAAASQEGVIPESTENAAEESKGIGRKLWLILAGIALIVFVICGIIGCSIGPSMGRPAGGSQTEEGSSSVEESTIEDDTEKPSESETMSETDTESESEKDHESETELESETEDSTEDTQENESESTEKPEPTKSPEPTPSPTPAASQGDSGSQGNTTAETGTPVANHGQLSVSGTQMVDEHGNPYQLRGVSTHGIAWFPGYVNYEAFKTMRDEWGINAVRLALYTAESNGYCTGGDQNYLKGLVKDGVSYATDLGLYVIIDWHVLNDNNPNVYKSQAISFFTEMATLYKDNNNVIYEICNEPCGGTSWADIKSYANEVIPAIRAIDPDAIIIVGTPNWSQFVDQAAASPIQGYDNIMYALHFYAATHQDSLRQTMVNAINAGLPVFVSEYGICDASGNGGIDANQANAWVNVMNQYGVSYMIWNLSNKSETSALIRSSCSKTSGWTYSELSDSGQWFVNMMGTAAQVGNSNDYSGSSGSGSGGSGSSGSGSGGSGSGGSGSSGSSGSGSSNVGTGQQASADNCTVKAECVNEWSSDGVNSNQQYTVTLTNTGSSEISGWKIVMTFTSDVTVNQGWGGIYTASGKTITITPESYNGTIGANQTCSDVGVIVVTQGTLAKVEIVK